MRKHIVLNSVAALSLGLLAIPFAQRALIQPQPLPRRAEAIGVIRMVNTAEVGERSQYGSYSSWETLLQHQPAFFDQWLAKIFREQTSMRFNDPPEILPGWGLRFTVRADGKGYDVRLEDLTDKKCLYAAVSDETGIIRQSLAIDCKIQP
jgi:hypothetical protein